MAQETPTKEGSVPFAIPGRSDLSVSTYYKIIGDLKSGATPVVMAHGGPGAGHDYLLSFADLWPQYGIPVVFYDQIGCGASTHLPETIGDETLWNIQTFLAELDNLVDHLGLREGPGFHLFGQSWGGILSVTYAAGQPRGLQRLVLANSLASKELSRVGYRLLLDESPKEVRDAIDEAITKDDFSSPAFQAAMMRFYKLWLCREEPFPDWFLVTLKHIGEAKAVNQTLNGRSVFISEGSMGSWTSIPHLPNIKAPTLVYNGEFDSAHDVAQVPFYELIPAPVRWITFSRGTHMCHVEKSDNGLRERVLRTVGRFLTEGSGKEKEKVVE